MQLVNKHNLSNENKVFIIHSEFFMVSFVITSCLDDDNNIEYSPDATIHAFALDTAVAFGSYKFTIDQLSREIYNEDSLPVHADTIIDKIFNQNINNGIGRRNNERQKR